MAEVVQLSIEYSTQGALAQIHALETRLNQLQRRHGQATTGARRLSDATRVLDGSFRGAGLGAVRLAENLVSGNISATTMASSMGKLGAFLLGPWGVAVALASAGVAAFVTQQRKAVEQAQKFEDQLRDTKRRVDELLAPGRAAPFASDIDKITDAIRELDRQIERSRGNIFERLFGGKSFKGFMDSVGRFLFGGVDPGVSGQRRGLQGQLGRLTPQAALTAENQRFGADVRLSSRLFAATGRSGRGDALQENIRLLNQHLERLAEIGDIASESMRQTGQELIDAERELRDFERGLKRMEDVLFTISDAIENFVITGTAAFNQFIENIFRILYRDASQQIIGDIIRGASGRSSTAGSVQFPAAPGVPNVPLGDVPTGLGPTNLQMHFNVATPDPAAWIDQNGDRIAAAAARKIGNSRALRTKARIR